MTSSGVLGGTAADELDHGSVPSTVAEITAALRQDPILVSQMLGNGATAQVLDALHAKLDLAQVPVYIVLTRTPVGLDGSSADEEIASLVHAKIGGEGIYYVHTSLGSGELVTYGDIDASVDNDDTLVSLARYTGLDQVDELITATYGDDARVAPATEAAIVLDVAANAAIPDYEQPVLTQAQLAGYSAPEWSTSTYYVDSDLEPASVGLSALTGISVGLVVAAVAFRLVRAAMAGGSAWPTLTSRSKRGEAALRPTPPAKKRSADAVAPADEEPDVRTRATAAVAALDDDLESRTAAAAAPERLRMAIESRDLARRLLAPQGAHPLDVVGAMVLALTASRAIREQDESPYRCCFVNPLHGAGRNQADLPGGLSVSVCRPCERALETGVEPSDALTETRRGRTRPYYAGDSVWARTGFGTLSDELWLDVQRDRGLR